MKFRFCKELATAINLVNQKIDKLGYPKFDDVLDIKNFIAICTFVKPHDAERRYIAVFFQTASIFRVEMFRFADTYWKFSYGTQVQKNDNEITSIPSDTVFFGNKICLPLISNPVSSA